MLKAISLKAISGLVITATGIAAGSISLFANVLTPPGMADWAWSLVGPWQDWTSEFWNWFAAPLELPLPSSLVAPLNVAAALLLTASGVRLRDGGQRSVKVIRYPFIQLLGAMVAVFVIGYVLLTRQSQPSGTGHAASDLPLLIFLAAAAASFSPALAGRGNLTLRLWLLLAVLAALLGLNELTKEGLLMTPALGS